MDEWIGYVVKYTWQYDGFCVNKRFVLQTKIDIRICK